MTSENVFVMSGKNSEKREAAIKTVALDTATFSGVTFHPTYINFFYGKNGSGKTSISRQFREGIGLQWTDGEVPSNYEIHVYNQDFIDQHFHTLDKLQGVFSLSEGEDSEKIERRIRELEEERKKMQKRRIEIEGEDGQGGERRKIKEEFETAEKKYQDACRNNTRTLREKFVSAISGASKNPRYAQTICKSQPEDCDEAELQKLYDLTFNGSGERYSRMTELDDDEHIAAIPTCSLLGEVVESRGNTEYARFIRDINALSWIREGHSRYNDAAGDFCPYCHQKLPDDFRVQFDSCFDEEYQKKLANIKSFYNDYTRHTGILYEILKKATEQDTLPSLDGELEKLKPMIENFLRASRDNMARIAEKLRNPAQSIELEKLTPVLKTINAVIRRCNQEIDKNNRVVAQLEESRQKCRDSVWSLIAFRVQGETEAYNSAHSDFITKGKRLDEEMKNIMSELPRIDKELRDLGNISTSIQAAVEEMNRLLIDSGFEGFKIAKNDMAKDAYKVVRGDESVAVRLSDGERHFLSFLYFYTRVKGRDPDGVLKDKIVVIDDPVSSLDGNALFLIGALVREMIEVCYNNTDYRGQTVKGDYIKQLFILTHNAQFYRNITYKQVGRFSSVSFYIINKVNNCSSIKLCIRQSGTEAGANENYNPVKNAYAALWSEYQELNSEVPLMNVIHHILEFYFLDMCGRDGHSLREEILMASTYSVQ